MSNKLKVTRVWIHRAEGRPSECVTREFEGEGALSRADVELRGWARTAPQSGGYDKCDFRVTWEDGETYEGRFDLTYEDRISASLGRHMVEFLEFCAGRRRPAHITEEAYRAYLKEIHGDPAPYVVWLDTRSFE